MLKKARRDIKIKSQIVYLPRELYSFIFQFCSALWNSMDLLSMNTAAKCFHILKDLSYTFIDL